MGSYVTSTKKEQEAMLHEIGLASFEDLFVQIPEKVRAGELKLPEGLSEMEALEKIQGMAEKNKVFHSIFRGAGAYNHYIPAIVKSVTSKEEFVTAYTPYQAEISQGVLQSIFEYQTMICELTGMDVSNASVYDGAEAAAEATAMCRDRKRNKVLVSACANPETIQVIKTYCFGNNMEFLIVPEKEGKTDMEELAALLDSGTACFYGEAPNFYGIIEDYTALGEKVHEAGAKYILGCNPISLGLLRTPAEYGADVAVGEGQPLGMELSFGGPYLGFMAATKEMMRKLPGRIVGETTDHDGRRAFVLTLQAREQHIRREKASSNICSNQALCAMTTAVYLSAMGENGMRQVAQLCISKSHYLQAELEKIGFDLKYDGPFFHEFVTKTPMETEKIEKALMKKGILSGLPIGEKEMLWCATEKNTKAQIDELIEVLKEVCGA